MIEGQGAWRILTEGTGYWCRCRVLEREQKSVARWVFFFPREEVNIYYKLEYFTSIACCPNSVRKERSFPGLYHTPSDYFLSAQSARLYLILWRRLLLRPSTSVSSALLLALCALAKTALSLSASSPAALSASCLSLSAASASTLCRNAR